MCRTYCCWEVEGERDDDHDRGCFLSNKCRHAICAAFMGEDEEEWGTGMRLTESRVRTKLSTSIESVAPSLAFSSVAFLGRAIMMEVWLLLLGLMG